MLKKLSIVILFILITSLVLLNKNQDKIILYKANSCLKNNNIECAQRFYEKAFLKGVTDENAREAYVNSLINNPLDLKAQEKLLKFLTYNIDDNAKLKLDYFLHDFNLEIFRKYSGNYIKQAVYNQEIMHWGKLPITYIIKDSSKHNIYEAEIKNAFKEWEIATGKAVVFEENYKNPNITIIFDSKNPSDKESKKFVVAHTTPNIISQKLENMVIKFYTTTPQGKELKPEQIYNTALHEIAHALGLMGHSSHKKNVMYMTRDTIISNTSLRDNITEADANTIKLLYKIKPHITNSNELEYEYLPEIILGEKEKLNSIKLEEAQNYIKNAPEIASGYIDLAETYVATKDYSKAIKTLEKALEIADTLEIQDIIYYNLAVTYFYIDNMEIAKDYLEESLKIKATDDKKFLLAEIYNKLGQKNLAEKEYKNLLESSPDNIQYTIALTNFYITNKKYLKARKQLKKFFEYCPEEKQNNIFKSYGILKIFL